MIVEKNALVQIGKGLKAVPSTKYTCAGDSRCVTYLQPGRQQCSNAVLNLRRPQNHPDGLLKEFLAPHPQIF